MSRFNAKAAGVVLATLAASGLPASADLVTFDFTVELTSVYDRDGVFAGLLEVGDLLTGRYTFEASTPDQNPSTVIGSYENAVQSISGQVGGRPFSGPTAGYMNLTSVRDVFGEPDSYRIDVGLEFLSNAAYMHLAVLDSTNSWGTGDDLPLEPFPSFDSTSFSLVDQPGGVTLAGRVVSITPEPGSLAFVGFGVLSVLSRTRG